MIDHSTIKKIRDKIDKDEHKLRKSITEVERIWEDTGLEPKDPTYLVEKTMRFEMAQENITKVFSSFNEIINDYKKLCSELEKLDEE
jgi:DNA repair ATPase RecN